jgi:hypothetical protein
MTTTDLPAERERTPGDGQRSSHHQQSIRTPGEPLAAVPGSDRTVITMVPIDPAGAIPKACPPTRQPAGEPRRSRG